MEALKTSEELQEKFESFDWDEYRHFGITIGAAALIGVLETAFVSKWYAFFYEHQTNTDLDKRHKLALKNVQNCFNLLYYCAMTVFGTIVLQKSNFLPRVLFGNGEQDISNMYQNYPVTPMPPFLREYFLASLGFHVQKSIKDVI